LFMLSEDEGYGGTSTKAQQSCERWLLSLSKYMNSVSI
jgi:hypothetical protein